MTTGTGKWPGLPAALTGAVLLSLLPPAHATDNWHVEGSHGQLYVHGTLTESACRLEMNSARQDVSLGETGTAWLKLPGAQGHPVHFEVRLEDCLPGQASVRDARTGALTRAAGQPVVAVRFQAERDADNPELVKAQGVSGLGLRLEDENGRDVRLGERGAPLPLMPGKNTLHYIVTPERTPAGMVAGSYRAVVDFHLSYD